LFCSALTKPDAADIARQKRLQQDIEKANSALEDLRGNAEEITADIKALEQKILDIGGTRLLKQKSTVDGLRLRIKLANDEITKAEVIETKATKDVAKYEEAIESSTAALEEVEQELEQIEENLSECRDYLSQLRQQVKKAQAAADSEKEDLDSLTAQLEEKTAEIQEFRQKEVSEVHALPCAVLTVPVQVKLETALTDTMKEAADNEKLLNHWQNEHDKLTLEDVE
jgi:structural maintenance of chromosome 4